MTPREQTDFVHELCKSVAQTVIGEILNGTIPEDWDGHELRELLAEKFNEARSAIMRQPGTVRKRNYKNTVLVKHL